VLLSPPNLSSPAERQRVPQVRQGGRLAAVLRDLPPRLPPGMLGPTPEGGATRGLELPPVQHPDAAAEPGTHPQLQAGGALLPWLLQLSLGCGKPLPFYACPAVTTCA